jgi:ubiquinone/menaquinone biosynthesis C-methylase UbiE
MWEQSKSTKRRFNDGHFHNKYFVGHGIDIGAGPDTLGRYKHVFKQMTQVDRWDLEHGDAQYMASAPDNTYDFVVSSHCFEHMVDPYIALKNWIRITKPGGYLVITLPEEFLYERGVWPSVSNPDHKFSFSIHKTKHNMPQPVSIMELLLTFDNINVRKLELIDDVFDVNDPNDQTMFIICESAIEMILQKV